MSAVKWMGGEPLEEEIGHFEQSYIVCVNPLCRRKWKRLSAKSMPLFCPACKKAIEFALMKSEEYDLSLLPKNEEVLSFWFKIYKDLVKLFQNVTCEWNLLNNTEKFLNFGEFKDLGRDLTVDEVTKVYHINFPVAPSPVTVRNWSSMGQRKKQILGKIVKKEGLVCVLKSYDSFYYLIDWRNQLVLYDLVPFVPFHNPSTTERDVLPFVLKVLDARVNPPIGKKDSSGSSDKDNTFDNDVTCISKENSCVVNKEDIVDTKALVEMLNKNPVLESPPGLVSSVAVSSVAPEVMTSPLLEFKSLNKTIEALTNKSATSFKYTTENDVTRASPNCCNCASPLVPNLNYPPTTPPRPFLVPSTPASPIYYHSSLLEKNNQMPPVLKNLLLSKPNSKR